jgi:hypothetical protein
MDNPEKLATYGIQVQEKQNKTLCGGHHHTQTKQLVNYGQTDDICGAGKIRRGDKCCLSQLCVGNTN